ncbi:MAG TPA: outer membrane protein assembly factor BamA [Candidatus Polarisedimenticolia bacterium]|nr:outer membrane protein assembly factor BamA [Candidatus Polarisedimenticolia bacterium]
MLRRGLRRVLAASGAVLLPLLALAQAETIERIVVDGNVRISTSALLSQLTIKEGDSYDPEALRREFRRLWELNLFDNITLEVRQGDKGKIVLWHVQDRPLIADVEYRNFKAFTTTQIDERLQDVKAEVRRGSPVDYTLIRKTQETLKQMLGQKGYLDAEVKIETKEIAPGQLSLAFVAHQAGKTKIDKIDFVGNSVFSDRQLKKMMKLTKEKGLFTWASSKDLYHPGKFDEDARILRQAYMDAGYLDVEIKPEVVELLPSKGNPDKPETPEQTAKRQKKEEAQRQAAAEEAQREAARKAEKEAKEAAKQADKAAKAAAKGEPPPAKPEKKEEKEPKTPKKWIYVTVPVVEGPQYHLASINVEGNKVFTREEILARVPVKEGGIFNDGAVKQGLGRIQLDYGEKGYFYVTANQVVERRPEGNLADLKIEIDEDKQYRINTLEFAGNSNTRDKVLRREIPVGEEDLFDLKRFRLGLRKINQLGYWQVTQDAGIHPRTGEDKVDVVIEGTESNRNEIQVGGGVSGVNGAFLSGSYATRNFLGRGEILQAYFQLGGRQSRYSLSFIEPWFMGKPWTLGASLFRRSSDFSNSATQEGHGGSLQVGRLLGTFSRLDFTYIYEFASAHQGSIATAETLTSSITPTWTYDSRNNFFRPTRGYRFSLSTQIAGGPLGGDNSYVKPLAFGTVYLPSFKKQYIGLNAAIGYVRGYEGKTVPVYDRFYLGGERSLRAFKSRTVGPARSDVDLNGNGRIDIPEDLDGDGHLDVGEDTNGNLSLDTEDLNLNGILDPGEDLNGNGILDTEDVDHDNRLDTNEDLNDNGSLDTGEDTNGDGIFGTIFPGGDKFVQFNVEYILPLGDTAEFVSFVDAGNAFDNGHKIDLQDLRMDYGVELRFYLPIFQAPLRFIYGFIHDPLPGEKGASFQFSIGTTF